MSLNLLQPDDAERNDSIAYTYQLIDLSAKLGVNLVSMFGGRELEKSVEDNIPRFREVFTPLAAYAAEKGAKIAFEAVGIEAAEAAARRLAAGIADMAGRLAPVRREAAIDVARLMGENLVSGVVNAREGGEA